jgi:hypothetical protein
MCRIVWKRDKKSSIGFFEWKVGVIPISWATVVTLWMRFKPYRGAQEKEVSAEIKHMERIECHLVVQLSLKHFSLSQRNPFSLFLLRQLCQFLVSFFRTKTAKTQLLASKIHSTDSTHRLFSVHPDFVVGKTSQSLATREPPENIWEEVKKLYRQPCNRIIL